jgi:hypothetical protein|tara:strand:- start:16334 stop:16858 length:525 start_codon:yes stop_codon:yes gene_type:complete
MNVKKDKIMGCGCGKGKDENRNMDPKKGFTRSNTINMEGANTIASAKREIKVEDNKPKLLDGGGGLMAMTGGAVMDSEELAKRLAPTPTPEPKKIGLLAKALSLGEALVNHVADGLSKTTKKEFAARLSICESCHHRSEKNNCGLCGCVISTKAAWKTSTCPDDRWPELTEEKE